jgi:hypothetical protein
MSCFDLRMTVRRLSLRATYRASVLVRLSNKCSKRGVPRSSTRLSVWFVLLSQLWRLIQCLFEACSFDGEAFVC